MREGLIDAEFSPSDLAKKLAQPKTGEFMVMTKEGEIHFIKERWLLTYHSTLSPTQLRRYKANGLAPYHDPLDTGIITSDFQNGVRSDNQNEAEALWNDVKDAIGQACSLLERILERDSTEERARRWVSILRDPDGIHRRLDDGERRLVEGSAELMTNKNRALEPVGLVSLLSESKRLHPGLSVDDAPRRSTQPSLQSNDSVLLEDDGSVIYKGRRFQLYRRYAGKSVTFVEKDGELKFLIEGKLLSKSFKL